MNIFGSKPFQFNGIDWQAVKRTSYRALGGALLTIIPQFIDPSIHYVLNFHGHAIDYSVVVVIAGTTLIRALEAYLSDNSAT